MGSAFRQCGCSSVVEHLLAKERVESSNLFIRLFLSSLYHFSLSLYFSLFLSIPFFIFLYYHLYLFLLLILLVFSRFLIVTLVCRCVISKHCYLGFLS